MQRAAYKKALCLTFLTASLLSSKKNQRRCKNTNSPEYPADFLAEWLQHV